jgi:hypothetical protein
MLRRPILPEAFEEELPSQFQREMIARETKCVVHGGKYFPRLIGKGHMLDVSLQLDD